MTIKQTLLIASTVFVFAACTNGNPNDHNDMSNSTSSGSYSAGNTDSTNGTDTLAPVQPNGMDTTGEQTGRMNNTASGASQPKKADTMQKK